MGNLYTTIKKKFVVVVVDLNVSKRSPIVLTSGYPQLNEF
jgi:hypothetical protein